MILAVTNKALKKVWVKRLQRQATQTVPPSHFEEIETTISTRPSSRSSSSPGFWASSTCPWRHHADFWWAWNRNAPAGSAGQRNAATPWFSLRRPPVTSQSSPVISGVFPLCLDCRSGLHSARSFLWHQSTLWLAPRHEGKPAQRSDDVTKVIFSEIVGCFRFFGTTYLKNVHTPKKWLSSEQLRNELLKVKFV